MEMSKDGSNVGGNKIIISCDYLSISGGWTPMVHLHTQSGGKLDFREMDQTFIPNEIDKNHINVGSCNGDFELEDIIKNTNNKVKNFLKVSETEFDNTSVLNSKESDKRNIWLLPNYISEGKCKSFIDFQNDSTGKDIKLALRAGSVS